MKTSDLISKLAGEAAPVRRLPSLSRRFAYFISLGVVLAGSTLAYFGFRPDLARVATNFGFQLESLALLILFAASTRLALRLSVPGEKVSRAEPWVIWGASFLALGWLALASLPHFSREALSHTLHSADHCIQYVGAVGIGYGTLFLWYLRRAAPLYPLQTGALALFSSGSLSALVVHLLCKSTTPLHLLVGHYLPLGGVTLAGLGLGQLFLFYGAKHVRFD